MTGSRKALIVVAVLFAALLGLPGVGAVPEAAAQVIQVDSALPDSAAQGTLSLPVTIKGSGFKKGAKAKFYLPNTSDPGGITVSSTRVVDSTQLVATIDVASTAVVSGFDIIVQNTDGRTGKGTELFKVTVKGGTNPVYEAVFVEFKEDDPTWEPKIRGDGFGAYSPVDMGSPGGGGGFRASMNLADGRSVLFQFNDPAPAFQYTLGCEAWFTRTPYVRQTPWYLLTTDNAVMPDQVLMYTSWELTWNADLQKWVRIVESQKRNSITYHNLDMLGMQPGQTSYSMFYLSFKLEPSRDYFLLNFNDTFYRELVPSGGTTKLNGGIVEVERPGPEEIWYIRPISNRFPVLGTPPTSTSQYQANHAIYDLLDEMGDTEGNCNLGNYLMKFEIRIARK